MRPCVIRHEAVVAAKPVMNRKQHPVIPTVSPIVRLVYRSVVGSIHRVEQIKIPPLIRIGDRRTRSTPAGTGDVNSWIGVDSGPHVQAPVPEIARRYHEFMAQLLLKGRVPVLLVSRFQVRAIVPAYAGERSEIRERVVLRRRQRLRERSTQALERIAKSADRVSELQQTAPGSGVGHKIGVIHFRIIVSYREGRTEGLPAVSARIP